MLRAASASRSFLGRQLAAVSERLGGAAPWAGAWRSLITVKVNEPMDRYGDQARRRGAPPSHAWSARARPIALSPASRPRAQRNLDDEVRRNEEMAIAHFSRAVRTEQQLGSIHQGGRRMKRLSRFVVPTEMRRREGALTAPPAFASPSPTALPPPTPLP